MTSLATTFLILFLATFGSCVYLVLKLRKGRIAEEQEAPEMGQVIISDTESGNSTEVDLPEDASLSEVAAVQAAAEERDVPDADACDPSDPQGGCPDGQEEAAEPNPNDPDNAEASADPNPNDPDNAEASADPNSGESEENPNGEFPTLSPTDVGWVVVFAGPIDPDEDMEYAADPGMMYDGWVFDSDSFHMSLPEVEAYLNGPVAAERGWDQPNRFFSHALVYAIPIGGVTPAWEANKNMPSLKHRWFYKADGVDVDEVPSPRMYGYPEVETLPMDFDYLSRTATYVHRTFRLV